MEDAVEGYRAEIRVPGPGDCPVAVATEDGDASGLEVSKAVRSDGDSARVTEEAVFDGEPTDVDAMEKVASYGDREVYRFDRPVDRDCACHAVADLDCPVVDVRTVDGDLEVAFHASDRATLRDAVAALEDRYGGVDVRRLLRTGPELDGDDLVFVDRSALTDRQAEVLRTAHDMGYFDHPKGANIQDVAGALDLAPSTVTEHLARAQSKLLAAVLD